jgi:hypothetical protein
MNLTEEPIVPTNNLDHPWNGGRSNKGAIQTLSLWTTAHNSALTIAAASVAPILYLLFVARYATNAFTSDDWTFIPIVHAALHGHLSLGQLWQQHTESRYFISNMINVLFGFVDGLDLRSLIFLSAAIFIASFAGLLLLVRQYLDKRLTPVPVLVVGAVWFSLADVQDSLWASHLWGFLVVFFFIMMLVVFFVPKGRRRLWFAVGVALAMAASVASIQGFLCWPLGVICILWNRPWTHRVRTELVVWVGFMAMTIALYLPGYNFSEGNTCLNHAQCSLSSAASHPGTVLTFFVTLIGNLIPAKIGDLVPGNSPGIVSASPLNIRFELLGAILLGVACFILVRSWRDRGSRDRLPLPLLLIVFSLLTDAQITLGRSGLGSSDALSNRYILVNLVLLTGIAVYAWARIPERRPPATNGRWRVNVTSLSLFAFAIFLAVQVTVATGFGLTNGRAFSKYQSGVAQIFVNANVNHQQLSSSRFCQLLSVTLYPQPGEIKGLHEAIEDRLGEFRPSSYRYFGALGPPPLPPNCLKAPGKR